MIRLAISRLILRTTAKIARIGKSQVSTTGLFGRVPFQKSGDFEQEASMRRQMPPPSRCIRIVRPCSAIWVHHFCGFGVDRSLTRRNRDLKRSTIAVSACAENNAWSLEVCSQYSGGSGPIQKRLLSPNGSQTRNACPEKLKSQNCSSRNSDRKHGLRLIAVSAKLPSRSHTADLPMFGISNANKRP